MQKTILSTADVARLFSVTETTVKRWADEGTLKCQRTPGGHRKFEIRFVIEFAEVHHFDPTGTLSMDVRDRLGPAIQVALLGRDFPALVDVFVRKALSPDETDLSRFFAYLYEHRIHLWELFDLIVQPGMSAIGEQWKTGLIGVGNEHRASHETLDALARLRSEVLVKPPQGHTALCACVGEEQHEIGLRCVAYLLESEGWITHYLGGQTPLAALGTAMTELRPDLVALSMTSVNLTPETLGDLRSLAALARNAGRRVVVGGELAGRDENIREFVDAVFASTREFLTYLDREFKRRQPPDTVH